MAKSKHQKTAAWVFGSVFVVFLIVAYFVTPSASLHHPIIRLIGALLAGLFGYFVTGSIKLVANAAWSPLGKLTIQVGGGAAMFVLVYFGWSQLPGPSATGGQQVETGDIGPGAHLTITQNQVQGLAKEQAEEINKKLDQILADKSAGEDPTIRKLTPEQQAIVDQASAQGDAEMKAKAAIANRDFEAAERYLAQASESALTKAFELLTIEGDLYYFQGRFDDAIGPYEHAFSLRPGDPIAMNNLAISLAQASLGSIAQNIRRAIELHERVLAQATADTPTWAMTQNNLGIAWSNLPTGDRGKNIETAMECYTAALKVYTREAHPVRWAVIQNNLGSAWATLPTGDHGENIDKAIECYTAALEVYTREAHPVRWATMQSNLGVAWANLPTGDRGENIEKAMECYTAALEMRTREAHPVDWATTQNNLGNAWADLPTGDRGENIDKAMECYSAALEVRTREAHPVYWATTQNNLGSAWAKLPTGDHGKNIEKAIEFYTAALEIFTAQEFPHGHESTTRNLDRAKAELAQEAP